MTSFIWNRSPKEAYQNPYEYEAQEQFAREAKKLLDLFYNGLLKYSGEFKRDERTVKKAVWMLQLDAVDSLRDCLELINEKRHRLASRLFRDVVETLDLATYFDSNDIERDKYLNDWFDDIVIPHRIYRGYLKKSNIKDRANKSRDFYSNLSKLNHRTYRSLAYSFILGRDERLIYEGYDNSKMLVLPQSIAMYYALLTGIIRMFSERLIQHNLMNNKEVNLAWESALETHMVPRRFAIFPPSFIDTIKHE